MSKNYDCFFKIIINKQQLFYKYISIYLMKTKLVFYFHYLLNKSNANHILTKCISIVRRDSHYSSLTHLYLAQSANIYKMRS